MKIKSLFRPQGPKTAIEISQALEQAEAARRQARTTITTLAEERVTALLTASDAEVDRIEAAQARTARELDRLDVAIAELQARLPNAIEAERAEARRQLWVDLLRRHAAAAEAFELAAIEMLAKFDELVATINDANANGFCEQVNHVFARPPALGPGSTAISERTIGLFQEARKRTAAAMPTEIQPGRNHRPIVNGTAPRALLSQRPLGRVAVPPADRPRTTPNANGEPL